VRCELGLGLPVAIFRVESTFCFEYGKGLEHIRGLLDVRNGKPVLGTCINFYNIIRTILARQAGGGALRFIACCR
jgi:hypothetical protein